MSPANAASRDRFEPFPLTEVQEAYWIGRQTRSDGANVACHLYLELEREGLDLPRLERAWQLLVERHDMLRAIVRPDGRQVVLAEVPTYEIEVDDLSACDEQEQQARLEATRERLRAQILPADEWPLWEIRATRLPGDRVRIHWSMDLLMVDGGSIALLMGEWAKLYEDPAAELPALTSSFRDYVMALEQRRGPAEREREKEILRALGPILPSPELPIASPLEALERVAFVRRQGRLDEDAWAQLSDRVRQRGLTPSGFLCALFAEVLRAWSRSRAFSLNATSAFRLPFFPDVHDLVGDFTSTFLLQIDGEGERFVDRAQRIQHHLLGHSVRHRHSLNGVRILKELSRREGRVGAALMPVVFTSNLGRAGLAATNFRFLGDIVYGVSQTPQVYFDHIVMEDGKALLFHWDVVEDVFPAGVVDAMFAAYVDLMGQFVRDDSRFEATRLVASPRRALPTPPVAAAPDRMLHSAFVERARAEPDRRAIWTQERTFSYGEVHALASRVAAVLRERDAGPEQLVAVAMHKGWEQVVACLGISMAGAAYVPIDPDLPPARIAELLDDAKVRIVLTQPHLEGRLSTPDGIQRIAVSEAALSAAPALPDASTAATAASLAYVIYTSGSTGRPKGVMIEHRAAVNTIDDVNERFGIGPGDTIFGLSSLSFDLSVYDLFGSLAAGACLALPSRERVKDPAEWAACLRAAGVTIWNTVPTLMSLLVEQTGELGQLRTILLSGDWIPLRLANRLRAALPDARLVSLGGATEAAIWSILFPIDRVDDRWVSIPYGRAMRGQQVYVLDGDLEPRPDHVPGELYISGAGLARGYWGDPVKTQQSFLTHPRTGERLYRTGDWGRYAEDGTIIFLGREDSQVKVHGHRIECGEIEATLARCPGVGAAAVSVREGRERDKRLIAFVAGNDDAGALAPADVRAYLQERLPDYMIPSAILVIPDLPLTANGKVDQHALRRLGDAHADAALAQPKAGGADEPMDDGQQGVARIVTSVLGHPVGLHDNLFEVGADSLHAIIILRTIQQTFGVTIAMDRLAKIPTIAHLALEVEEAIIHELADTADT